MPTFLDDSRILGLGDAMIEYLKQCYCTLGSKTRDLEGLVE